MKGTSPLAIGASLHVRGCDLPVGMVVRGSSLTSQDSPPNARFAMRLSALSFVTLTSPLQLSTAERH